MVRPTMISNFSYARNVVLSLSADTNPRIGKNKYLKNIFLVNRHFNNWQKSMADQSKQSRNTSIITNQIKAMD
jgi:hypothetical protein